MQLQLQLQLRDIKPGRVGRPSRIDLNATNVMTQGLNPTHEILAENAQNDPFYPQLLRYVLGWVGRHDSNQTSQPKSPKIEQNPIRF